MDINKKELRNAINKLMKQLVDVKMMIEEDSSSPVFPGWAKEKLQNGICLVCNKGIKPNEKAIRGNHSACRKRVARAISNGEYTEAEATGLGILAPRKTPGTKEVELDPRAKSD